MLKQFLIWFSAVVVGGILIFLIALSPWLAFGQDLSMDEIQRQKAEVQKDFAIGKLMIENAQMRFEKLLQLEEALKIKAEKEKKTK